MATRQSFVLFLIYILCVPLADGLKCRLLLQVSMSGFGTRVFRDGHCQGDFCVHGNGTVRFAKEGQGEFRLCGDKQMEQWFSNDGCTQIHGWGHVRNATVCRCSTDMCNEKTHVLIDS